MRGFTLIETVLYVALLAIFMTGALIGSYNLVTSASRTSSSALAQEEGAFVEKKLEWAMAGMTSTPTVGGSGCSGTLTISKTGAPAPIKFKLDTTANAVAVCEDSACTYLPITSSNVAATCFSVSSIPANGTGPSGVSVTFNLKQLTQAATPRTYTYAVTHYVRQ